MTIEKRGSFNLGKSIQKFKSKKRTLPKQIGKTAINFFKTNFRRGGFVDRTLQIWEPRFKRISRTRISRRFKEKATLIKSGRLWRSLGVISATFSKIVLGTRGVVYARRHNEGLTDRLGRKMVKRQYVGDSRTLDRKIERQIFKEIDKVFDV